MRHGACNGTATHPRGLQRQSKTANFACTLGKAKQKLGNIFGNWRNYFEIKFLVALPLSSHCPLQLPHLVVVRVRFLVCSIVVATAVGISYL